MNEEYEKGQEIGEIRSDIKNILLTLDQHNQKQDEWNKLMELRVRSVEDWMKTTIGKISVFTIVFGIIGSIIYFIVNYFIQKQK